MTKLNKNKLSGQEFFSLEEISNLLEDEKENIGKYIQEGYLKIGKDLKVHRNDLLSLIEHILNNPQNNKSKVTIKGASFLLWVTTVLLFVLSIDTINSPDNNYPLFLSGLGLTNIILGIIAFIIVFFAALTNTKDKVANHNLNPMVKYSPLLIVLYFVFYFSALSINHHGLIASQIDYQPQPTPFVAKTEIQTLTPTPTSKLIPKKVQPIYVDPDPITSCQNPNCGSINIKKSLCSDTVGYVCCQIGSKWIWYASRDKCTEDRNVANKQIQQPSSTQQTTSTYTSTYTPPPSYPSCTVYYSIIGPQTYNDTSPETCKMWQDAANAGSKNTYTAQPTPTLTENQAQVIVEQHNSQVMSCQDDVVHKYNVIIQSCNNKFGGGSSAGPACTSIASSQRQIEYNACGTIY